MMPPRQERFIVTDSNKQISTMFKNPCIFALIFSFLQRRESLASAAPAASQSSEVTPTGEELAQIYRDIFSSYPVFPPLTSNYTVWDPNLHKTHPIEVSIATVFVSIDTIDPARSEFSATSRSMMYWKQSDCDQTTVHQVACSRNLDGGKGFKFLRSDNSVGEPKTILLNIPNAHSQVFADRNLQDLQPDADIIENQITFKQTFDMRNYPYEYHELEVRYSSQFTSNVVNLSMLPDIDPDIQQDRPRRDEQLLQSREQTSRLQHLYARLQSRGQIQGGG